MKKKDKKVCQIIFLLFWKNCVIYIVIVALLYNVSSSFISGWHPKHFEISKMVKYRMLLGYSPAVLIPLGEFKNPSELKHTQCLS